MVRLGMTARYYLLKMGDGNPEQVKYWTQEEALEHVFRHAAIASGSEWLEITTDTGDTVFTKAQILSIIRSRKVQRILFPLLMLLFAALLVARGSAGYGYLFALNLLVLFAYVIVCWEGVAAGNTSLWRRIFGK